MQVAPETAALLLRGTHEPFARPLQVGGETHGVRGDACLPCEVVQQPPIGGREILLASTRGEEKLADGLVLVDERQADR